MIHLAAEKACYVARSVNKTPTAAVLKEALETVIEWDWITSTPWVFYRQPRNVLACLILNSHDFFLLYNQQTPRTVEDLPTTSTEKQSNGPIRYS